MSLEDNRSTVQLQKKKSRFIPETWGRVGKPNNVNEKVILTLGVKEKIPSVLLSVFQIPRLCSTVTQPGAEHGFAVEGVYIFSPVYQPYFANSSENPMK